MATGCRRRFVFSLRQRASQQGFTPSMRKYVPETNWTCSSSSSVLPATRPCIPNGRLRMALKSENTSFFCCTWR